MADFGSKYMAEWFQDEFFWIDTYPFLFPDQRFEAAEEQVEKLLILLAFQRPHKKGDSNLFRKIPRSSFIITTAFFACSLVANSPG